MVDRKVKSVIDDDDDTVIYSLNELSTHGIATEFEINSHLFLFEFINKFQ